MILIVSLLIIASIVATKFSSKFGLPLLIGFILIGIIAGSDVLNLFYFDNAVLTKQIADILLIFIIFDGGFRVTRQAFKSAAGPSLSLATAGVVLTSLVLGTLIHLVLKFDLMYSLLVSSIISSTDAAAVFMITRSNPINKRLATTLNVESAANDPMAIILTVAFIQLVTRAFSSPGIALIRLCWQFVGGVGLGYAVFRISLLLFRTLKSESRGNYNVLMIGCVLFAYGSAEILMANGIIAVFFMGYWMGNSDIPAKRSISGFLESVSSIFNIALFIMLGLLAFPHRFVHIWKEALFIVFVMMFIARPIAILLCTFPFKYSFREKLVLMWGGIKGAVPIVLATYPLANGLDESGFIFDTIFFAVFLSCIVQGTTLAPLARLFRFTDKRVPVPPHVVELHSTKSSDLDMFEVHVEPNACCLNRPISELNLGKEVLISSIIRNGTLILPKGNTVIHKDDILFILAHSSRIEGIIGQFNGMG